MSLDFLLLDHANRYQGQLKPIYHATTLMWNDESMAAFTVDDDHPVLDLLEDDLETYRARLLYKGERVMEGPIELASGSGPMGQVTLTCIDDLSLVNFVLGWQRPDAALSAQTDEYRRYSGPLETVVKTAITENAVSRLGLPWTVAASQGRGPDVAVDFRMHPLGDKLLPLLRQNRLGLRIQRDDDLGYVVDVYEGEEIARPLTLESGTIDTYTWNRARRKATRAVVGGNGQGVERRFDVVVDPAAEALIGVREIFDDARMTEGETSLIPHGMEALAERAATSGVTATLNEASWFQFMDGYKLGDVVPVKLGRFETTDVISEIGIEDLPNTGFRVKPKIGLAKTTTDERMAALIRRLMVSARDSEKR